MRRKADTRSPAAVLDDLRTRAAMVADTVQPDHQRDGQADDGTDGKGDGQAAQ